MIPPAGAADVVAGATGAGAGVDVRAGGAVVVGSTVTVLGGTVTVETDDVAAVVDCFSFSSEPPAIAAITSRTTTAPIPPKIHGFFDFFGGWGCVQVGWPSFGLDHEGEPELGPL
jgi:hypothetical protein